MKRVAIALTALVVVVLAGLIYLGYFGGTLFIPVPATASPTKANSRLAAVVLSGDMGFNIGMGRMIAERLSKDGIPVIGVNSLVYFRTRRTPAEVEQMLAAAMRKAQAFGHTDHVILIGQSFGADMIPLGLSLMPAELREKIAMVGLVVPTDTLFLRASPSELFNWSKPDADALPTARMLDWVPVTCISGREETESLCPHMTSRNVRWITLPGGHLLDRDPDLVHRVLMQSIEAANSVPTKITKVSGG